MVVGLVFLGCVGCAGTDGAPREGLQAGDQSARGEKTSPAEVEIDGNPTLGQQRVIDLRWQGKSSWMEFDAAQEAWRFGLTDIALEEDGRTTQWGLTVYLEVGAAEWRRARADGDFGSMLVFVASRPDPRGADKGEVAGCETPDLPMGSRRTGEPWVTTESAFNASTSMLMSRVVRALERNNLEIDTDRLRVRLDSKACDRMRAILKEVEEGWRRGRLGVLSDVWRQK